MRPNSKTKRLRRGKGEEREKQRSPIFSEVRRLHGKTMIASPAKSPFFEPVLMGNSLIN